MPVKYIRLIFASTITITHLNLSIMQNFNFNSELVNKVKNNWLVKDNANEFARCKTDAQWCLTFAVVCYKTDMELELAKEITDVAMNNINNNRD